MEKKSPEKPKNENKYFVKLLEQSKLGNKSALEDLLMFFKDYIYSLCRYINMPKEDAAQELYVELIKIILEKDMD